MNKHFVIISAFLLLTASTSLQASEYDSHILVKGSTLQGANGVRISPDGKLYATSAVGSRIDVIEPTSGKILYSLDQSNNVFGPDDLAFSPSGQLYWTAFFSGLVMRLNDQNQGEIVAQVGPGVNAISFSANGRLFVTRVFLADELYEIDPQGIQAPRLVTQGMGGLNAMDFGPDGYLYGPLWFKGQIAKIDVDNGDLTVISEGLSTPSAVKFSPEGILHALDQHEGSLLRINTQNGSKEIVALPGVGADNMDFDADGKVFVTNAHLGSISRVLPNGKATELRRSGLSMPAGLTIDSQGELVVAATLSMRNVNPKSGATISITHTSIGDPRNVATPLTISTYGDLLLVSSWFSNTVQLWDPVKQTIVATYLDFQVPMNAISFNGDLIVAELASHRVVRRNMSNGSTEVLMNSIPVPTGLAASRGNLYAADWLSGTVYQLIADNTPLNPPVPITTGLSQPEGMAIDNEGNILLIETGKRRLIRIEADGHEVEVVKDDLDIGLQGVPGYPPHWLMSSVVVDPCGNITLSQDMNNTLLRIETDNEQNCD